MRILSGLFPGGVLQRTADDVCDVVFTGQCKANGPVLARVMRDGAVVPGCESIIVGTAEKRAFSGRLTGLPVGGPYAIEFSVGNERLTIDDVLVGDVWILAGQSNMQGCGSHADRETPHPQVRAWYMDDCWAVADDPLHNMWASVDQVHADLYGGIRPPKDLVRGTGPGVAFGVEMQRLTGVPQGLIACAHGGTSMAQWDPRLKRNGSRSLYGAMLRRVRKVGGRVAGMVWYQGCSDTFPEAARDYTRAMRALVAAVRRDLKAPDLPVAMVQIATVFGQHADGFPCWNDIQEQQRKLPGQIKCLEVVPAIDLALDDLIHISGTEQNRLGRRLAAAMRGLVAGNRLPAITPKSVKAIPSPMRPDTADIVITFDHVVGALQAPGRPWGFTLVGDGPQDVIYRVDLDGNRVILRTVLVLSEVAERVVWYGYRQTPYCNITDSADRALPVFGPLPIGKPRALTPFARKVRVSAPQALRSSMRELGYPGNLQALGLAPREFAGSLIDTHLMTQGMQTPHVIYYACRFRCSETMSLAVQLGYDGPVKLWIDGAEVFCDPAGTNPAIPDQGKVAVEAAAGEHEALIALDLNGGRAWGAYLRFERTGLSKQAIALGGYAMPEMLE